jgi:hypothetical protein
MKLKVAGNSLSTQVFLQDYGEETEALYILREYMKTEGVVS